MQHFSSMCRDVKYYHSHYTSKFKLKLNHECPLSPLKGLTYIHSPFIVSQQLSVWKNLRVLIDFFLWLSEAVPGIWKMGASF